MLLHIKQNCLKQNCLIFRILLWGIRSIFDERLILGGGRGWYLTIEDL